MEAGSDRGTVPPPELHRSLYAGHMESHLQVYAERRCAMGTVHMAVRSPRRLCAIQQEVVRSGSSKHRVQECSGRDTVSSRSWSSDHRNVRTCGGLDALRAACRIRVSYER